MSAGGFLKYTLEEKKFKSIPLMMYEKINGKKFTKGKFFGAMGEKSVFNHFILNFRIRHYDLKQKTYSLVNLGELLSMNPEQINEMVKNRIVVIGSFAKEDMHKTIYGDMPGALILLNVYLALVNQDNVVCTLFFIVLFVSYTITSFMAFYPLKLAEKGILKYFKEEKILKFIMGWLSFVLLLILISAVTYFMFNIHINILYLSIYLYALRKIMRFIYKRVNFFKELRVKLA